MVFLYVDVHFPLISTPSVDHVVTEIWGNEDIIFVLHHHTQLTLLATISACPIHIIFHVDDLFQVEGVKNISIHHTIPKTWECKKTI